ncbi:methyl-accepting chemotaxis protein [Pseudoxanthomonas sp. PXM01]|uniref:methyl-accepting chemotaxis protein n=1 Tax=Pseudoxanthomonas sp. PXM01 TaxID=2769295 RepID=UPI0017844AAE|nr:methyl-accepting chemotaxis protein [Pseudoxanthomonas sp. PXM01]MBD9467548.1 MCP four helix bundle domain-containing protein [Pseudoxanthomonas sp. PXM01]
MFKHLKIGKRLAIGFAVLVLLIVVTGAFSAQRMGVAQGVVVEITNKEVPAIRDLGRLATMLAEYRVSERGLVANYEDPDKVAEYTGEMVAGDKAFDALSKAYGDSITDKQEQELYQQMLAKSALYFDNSRQLIESVKVGDLTPASDAGDLRQAVADAVARMLDDKMKGLDEAVAAQQAGYNSNIRAIGLLVVVAMLLAIAAAVLITRSIVRPIGDVMSVADAVARGQLDRQITVDDRSETGDLLNAMQRMQTQVRSVIAAQSEMAARHDEGRISYRMDDSAFPGDYGRMVRDTNALVASHIAVKMRLAEVMQRYSIGDLSVDMDRLPGEKAVLTETMDATKASLSAINAEIKRLAHAASSGDFTQRGDVDKYQYDFRDMVAGLNQLMETTDRNLAEVSELLKAIARGDLTARMEGDFHGVFAIMRDDANATVGQLTEIVGGIQTAALSINTAAGEIASGNNDLSRRTEQQAANLEETAASMEELTSTVRQNAESARQANQLAIGAASVASQGGDVVGKVVTTMTDIEQSSKKIAEIISVIDGIAFQTNILALNAAVEAARAGEQGRGFAVVASEVRTLAQRSANAAKEIKGLIETSVDKVADGSALVNQAGATMAEIVASVQRVTDIMAEISAASQEQSAGIEQVNQTITQMDEATQQNAALVEEATAAARSMEEQAQSLTESVAVFKLHATTGAPVRKAIAAAPAAAPRPVAKAVARKPAARLPEPALADGDWQEF